MAESQHSRTEQPTHRRQQKARDRGQVVHSKEMQTAFLVLASAIGLRYLGPAMYERILRMLSESLAGLGDTAVTEASAPKLAATWASWLALSLLPLLLTLSTVTLAGTLFIQGGAVFSTESLSPNLGRLNPAAGLGRMFSNKALFSLLRDWLKVGLIGWICFLGVKGAIAVILNTADAGLTETTAQLGAQIISIITRTGGMLLLIGLLDYSYQRRQHRQDLKMTKKEVKDELKEQEGSPLMKGRIRSRQKEVARSRMMDAVPTADVVLTNPTHIAVALKYDQKSMSAPQVVAKGQRLVAERIKEIARQAGVPIIEDKPLARALFKMAPIGAEIPAELYRAVAEVLGSIYRLRGRVAARNGQPEKAGEP